MSSTGSSLLTVGAGGYSSRGSRLAQRRGLIPSCCLTGWIPFGLPLTPTLPSAVHLVLCVLNEEEVTWTSRPLLSSCRIQLFLAPPAGRSRTAATGWCQSQLCQRESWTLSWGGRASPGRSEEESSSWKIALGRAAFRGRDGEGGPLPTSVRRVELGPQPWKATWAREWAGHRVGIRPVLIIELGFFRP